MHDKHFDVNWSSIRPMLSELAFATQCTHRDMMPKKVITHYHGEIVDALI